MTFAAASQPPPGKRPGKQNRPRFDLRGSTGASKARALDGARRLASRPAVEAENSALVDLARDCREFWGVSAKGVFSCRFFDREWTRGLDCEGVEDRC
jgi:hypothetical protein